MWTVSQMLCAGILISLSIVDIQFKKVPVDMLALATALVIIYQGIMKEQGIGGVLGGAAVGALFFGISKATREGIGYGDSWAILIMGIFLGMWGVIEVLAGAFMILSVVSVLILSLKKINRKRRFPRTIPFFPFLAIGYVISILG